jgi:hypothetical protein
VGGGKGNNKTKSTFKLPPEFIKAYNESLGLAREAIQKPYTPYTGQLVAGLTPGQQQGIANIQAAQGMALPFIQEGAGLTREAARGITPELYQRFYSPYVRDVASATQANLLESAAQQRSGLKGGAIQAGAFGGDRAGIAQAEMARQQQLANAQAMANIYNQGYTQAMGLAGGQVQNLGAMGQQLAGMGTGAQTSALQGAQAQMAAGAQEQATAQAQLQAAYDQFLQQQSYPFQIAQYFANIAQGLGSTAGGTSTTKGPPPNTGSQILGGIGALANIAGALPFSDARMKENIEAVGQLNDGQTIYRYNFKGDPKTQIGLLAQEVEEVNPNAVGEVGGFKTVDYKGATDEAASSMGGVVAPGMDRQNFMNGGIPYGGSGFVPQGTMSAGTNKIPGPAQAAQDAGLAGAADMTKPFTEQQNKGVANIASMFMKPSIYASGGVVGRHGFADGGVPYMPYSGGRGWVPEGKMGGGGSRIPDAPKAFEDKGLAEDWEKIVPVSSEQAAGLVDAFGRAKKALGFGPDPDMAAASYMGQPDVYERYAPKMDVGPMPSEYKFRLARGGVAGRNGYQFGGEPTMEDAMAEAEGMGLVPPARREPRYDRLLQKESGGDFGARNPQGYVGRAQFGEARLADAKKAGVIPAGATPEDFRMNPDMQKAAEDWHFGDINNFIDRTGLASMEGKVINGVPITREGMVNVAHLGGKGGLQKFITSGGRYNPADANGTRLSDYFAMGAAGGGESIQPMSADASGLGGAPQPLEGEVIPPSGKPKSGFSFKNLFASETNPSIVEQIIGRRLSPEARAAMLNASFALMAGRSPYFMTNLGEAGRVGTQTYYNALAQKQEAQKQAAEQAQQQYTGETARMVAETAREKAVREQQEAAARQRQLEEAVAQLPPNQQAAARLAPDEFFKAQAESIFGTADLPNLVKEYREAVKGGYTGTLEDWKKIGSSDAKLGLQLVPLTDNNGNFIGYGQASSSGGIYYQGELVDGTNLRPMDPGLIAQTKSAGALAGSAPEYVVKMYSEKIRPAMESTSEALLAVNEAEKLLQTAQTGAGAEIIQSLRGLGATLGFNVDENILADTQAYQNFISNIVLPKMQQLGGNDSNEELRYLKSTMGGDITQARTAIEKTMQLTKKLLNQRMEQYRAYEKVALPYLGITAVPDTSPLNAPVEAMPDVSKMTEEQLEAIVSGEQ